MGGLEVLHVVGMRLAAGYGVLQSPPHEPGVPLIDRNLIHFAIICHDMDWFEGRQRALNQDTAVYDLFTVARPKQKKPKKVERAKSSHR